MADNAKKVLTDEFAKQAGVDPTNQPQATTQADVDAQDARTRLWQSMNYTYGKQLDNSNKSYDQAYSQADRQALSRGMQRSSYNAQTLANINQQKINAQNDIAAAQIADYQNRLGQIEQQEQEQANWEKEFGLKQQQLDLSEKQWQAQQDQWKQEFEYNKMSDDQKLAYNYVTSILGQGGNPSDDLLARAGLTRADADAMKAKVSTGGSGRSRRKDDTGGEEEEGPGTNDDKFEQTLLYNRFRSVPASTTTSNTGVTTDSYQAALKEFFNNHTDTMNNFLKKSTSK